MGKVFSGIQSSGIVHIGNYLGALRQWVELQKEHDCVYCIVDLHAITVPQDPKELEKNVLLNAAICLSVGVNPERSVLFAQSDVPQHSELCWILNCFTYMGELRRMTQFKDKTAGEETESVNTGLFDYPVLMAADIFLYDTTHVPVGDDQRQHLELARTLARRFNGVYGEVFRVPESIVPKQGARIMGLDDPSKKMSKSASSAYSYIALNDPPDTVRAKIKSAVTDSGREIVYDPEKKPALANLLDIFSLTSGRSLQDLQSQYGDKGYAVFKKDLGEALVEFLRPIQEKMNFWLSRPEELKQVMRDGAERAGKTAAGKMRKVRSVMGLGAV